MDSQFKLDKKWMDSQIKLDKGTFGHFLQILVNGIPNFWIARFPDISNLAWVEPGLGLGWACGSAVLGPQISEFWTYWNPCVKGFQISKSLWNYFPSTVY